MVAAVHPSIQQNRDRLAEIVQERKVLSGCMLAGLCLAVVGAVLLPLSLRKVIRISPMVGGLLLGVGAVLGMLWVKSSVPQRQWYLEQEGAALAQVVPQWQQTRDQLQAALVTTLQAEGVNPPLARAALRAFVAQREAQPQNTAAYRSQQWLLERLERLVEASQPQAIQAAYLQGQATQWQRQLAQMGV
jgi:hypothetical protein